MVGAAGGCTWLGRYDGEELERLGTRPGPRWTVTAPLYCAASLAPPNSAVCYPAFFRPHRSGRTFVLGLDSGVHVEARKLYVGASGPRFAVHESAKR